MVGTLGLGIRCGIHTGECVIEGNDVTGIAVHIGARIAARANPGEIFLSSTVKDLIAGSRVECSESRFSCPQGRRRPVAAFRRQIMSPLDPVT